MKRFILLVLISVSFYSLSYGQGYDIAIMAAEGTQAHRDDVKSKLEATGIFNIVDEYDVSTTGSTPSTATMLNYDAILVWSNSAFADPITFGNNLAAYIEAGGGVVTNMFSFYNGNGNAIEGNFAINYQLIIPTGNFYTGPLMSISDLESTHPVVNEVFGFNGGSSSFHGTGLTLSTGSVTLDTWVDASPFAVYKENVGPSLSKRVDLNFWPVSTDVFVGGWVSQGDKYLANSLAWVAGGLCNSEVLSAESGSIDDGSGNLDYHNGQNCSWLIQPTGASSVTLTFSAFNTESSFDFVDVYDGTSTGGTLLGSFSGTSLPSSVTANSGSMYIVFDTDGSVVRPGWSASYTSFSEPLFSTETDITAFSFPEEAGPAAIDDINHTVDIEVNAGTDVSNLVATFSLSSGAMAEIGGVGQSSGSTSNDFSNPVTYTITAEDFFTTQDWVVTVLSAPNSPGLFSYAESSTSIVLNWNDQPNEDSYELSRSDDDITYSVIANLGVDVTSFTDTGLAPNTLYYYKITASNAQGVSPESSRYDMTFSTSFATKFENFKVFGGTGYDFARALDVDTQGNYYYFGRYTESIEFDGTILTTSSTGTALFLVKYDADDNLIWARSYESMTGSSLASDVKVSPSGGLYITGYFLGDATGFQGLGLISNLGGTENMGYLLKVEPSTGDIIFSRGLTSDRSFGNDLAFDNAGGIYVGAGTFDNGSFAGTNWVSGGSCVLKYDESGNELWIQLNESINDQNQVDAVVSDGTSIYAAGHFQDNFTVAGVGGVGNIFLNGSGPDQYDMLLYKIDNNGGVIWANEYGSDSYDAIWDLTMDNESNIYFGGWFEGASITIGGTTHTNNSFIGVDDMVIGKVDPNGNELWSKAYGATGNDYSLNIESDGENIYTVTRKDKHTLDFDGIQVENGTFALLSMDKQGVINWIEKLEGQVIGRDMAIGNGYLYVPTSYYNAMNVGGTIYNTNGDRDIGLGKIGLSTLPPVTAGLVGYYPFSGNTNDPSGNGNHGTMLGDPQFVSDRFGNPNSALTFDGNDYVRVDHEGAMGTTGDWTVNTWVNFNQQQGGFPIILWDDGYTYNIISQNFGGKLEQLGFHYNQNGSNFPVIVSDPYYIPFGVWTMLTMRGNSNGEGVDMFINGVSVASFNIGGRITDIGQFLEIGGRSSDGSTFIGAIDDVSIYTEFLVDTDIMDLYHANDWTGPSDLIAHWPVSAAEGGNDISGNGNFLNDEASGLGASAPDRFRVIDDAFDYTGSNYAVAENANHPQGENVDFTYSLWEYHNSGDQGTLLDIGNGESQLRLGGDIVEYSSNVSSVFSNSPANSDRWNHIVVIGSGLNVLIYINGVLVQEQEYTRSFISSDIYTGNNENLDAPFTGRMDDIRIFNFALNETDVLNLFDERVDTSIPIVQIEPSLATPDDQIRLIYNAERGNKGLMGLEGENVHIHGGVITTDPGSYGPWENVLDPTFVDNSIGEMTRVSGTDNQWEITIQPSIRDFFGVPNDGTPIYKISSIFRSASGNGTGNGIPEFGDFPGGHVTDGALWTTGDIYMTIVNPTPLQLDSLALVALYQALNGDSWFDNSNWLTGPIDTWTGVTVSGGRVVDVYLDDNNLVGELPSAIGRLDACNSFSVSFNNISGSIPAAIGDMTALNYLYLDENQLSGSIPTEIGNLTNLIELVLDTNGLTGTIPGEIGNLTGLRDLSLFSNQLVGSLPISLQNLVNLVNLDIEDNNLSGLIPTYLGNFSLLESLWLSANNFSGEIPVELGNLLSLNALYLDENSLTGEIPTVLGNLFNLSALDLSTNNLTGEIPTELGNLLLMVELDLSENILEGAVPAGFSSMSFLSYLYVSDNLLTSIPSLASTSIMELSVEYNKFTMEDILVNLPVVSSYSYEPQELVGEPQTRFVPNGTNYTFDLGFDENVVGSTYEWYLEGGLFTSTSVPNLDLFPISFANGGNWTVFVTNSSLPGLTLETEDIQINVQDICISAATGDADTRIDRVVFGDLDNGSNLEACATYTNFTETSATIYPGQAVDVGITMGTCGSEFNKTAVFYIDWNQDGSFDDGTERVWTTATSSITEFQTDIYNVPTDAVIGTYLMRVVAQETSDANAITGCSTYSFGETEDYTVNVVDGAPDLIMELVDVTPNSVFNSITPIQAGNEIAVTTTLGNSGLGEVVDLVRGIAYYLSDDQLLDGSDVELGSSTITSLPGGEIITLTDVLLTIPTNTSVGAHYLIVEADPDGTIADPDLSDNVDVSTLPIHVSAPPDQIPPTITLQTAPPTYEIGIGGQVISAEIMDNFELATVTFAYARTSDLTDPNDVNQFTVITPEEITTGVYAHTLVDSDFDDIGIQYYFEATDIFGNKSTSLPFPSSIGVEFGETDLTLNGQVSGVSSAENATESDYRLFSVPVRNATVGSVLGINSMDKEEIRMYRYSNGNQEITSVSTSLDPGKGYWLIYVNSVISDLNFGGLAVDATNANPFIMQLTSGINLIGNPYNFAISWNDIVNHNVNEGILSGTSDVSSGITFYTGGFQAGNTTLDVTEAGFIESFGSFNLEIPFSANTTRITNAARYKQNPLDQEAWEVGLDLANEVTFYNVASIGMDPQAELGVDNLDQHSMPYITKYLQFNSKNALIEDKISQDFVQTSENHIWEFEAATNYDPSETVLSWDNSYFGDNDKQLYLYDLENERIINMRDQEEYKFNLKDKRNFKIYYGTNTFIESELKPTSLVMNSAYPNPLTDHTRIEFSLSEQGEDYQVQLGIYDTMGKLVQVLLDGQLSSGFHAVDWDGTHAGGQQVPDGIYIYKLRVTDKNDIREFTNKLMVNR